MSEQGNIEVELRRLSSWQKDDNPAGRHAIKIIDEAADEIASLRTQLAEEKAKHALTIQHADQIGSQLASARKALELVCDEIEDTEEHGGGADENYCPVCEAIRAARVLLTDELREVEK